MEGSKEKAKAYVQSTAQSAEQARRRGRQSSWAAAPPIPAHRPPVCRLQLTSGPCTPPSCAVPCTETVSSRQARRASQPVATHLTCPSLHVHTSTPSPPQLYEATKRATQDVTAHAKEAAARGGLKDVRAVWRVAVLLLLCGRGAGRAAWPRMEHASTPQVQQATGGAAPAGAQLCRPRLRSSPPLATPLQVKQMAGDASKAGGMEGMAASVSRAAGAAGQKISEAASQ